MLLRPRQKLFVERCLSALKAEGNTLGVAPTGAGKTVMLSAVTGSLLADGGKACILAHRDELTAQNRHKFGLVNPDTTTSVVDASRRDWSGGAVFAMAPTLAREGNLSEMPALDALVIDEAHHATADSYRRIIDRAQVLSPALKLFGVTATPARGDKKALRQVFSNVGDQIRIGELVASGHLVPPRTFVIDVGTQDALRQVKRTAEDFDMTAVDAIMNKAPVTEAVIRHWREKASDCPTVVFCSTVGHAENVAGAFNQAGIPAVFVHGGLSALERRNVLQAFTSGEAQVIVNVAVLTEGWDHPPTSCVVLLRPSSFKSTMIQMIGRGLRTVDPELYPGVVKSDCVVLDFGTSTLMHGSLEQDVSLDAPVREKGEPLTTACPDCQGIIPVRVRECPLCGSLLRQESENAASTPLTDFVMAEIDLLRRSSFRWCDLYGDDTSLMAQGFHAWAGIFFWQGHWHAVGGSKEERPRLLAKSDRMVALAAADDWLNIHESEDSAHKSRRWLDMPATSKQLSLLPSQYQGDYGLTRYQASALVTFRFNRQAVQRLIFSASSVREAA